MSQADLPAKRGKHACYKKRRRVKAQRLFVLYRD